MKDDSVARSMAIDLLKWALTQPVPEKHELYWVLQGRSTELGWHRVGGPYEETGNAAFNRIVHAVKLVLPDRYKVGRDHFATFDYEREDAEVRPVLERAIKHLETHSFDYDPVTLHGVWTPLKETAS